MPDDAHATHSARGNMPKRIRYWTAFKDTTPGGSRHDQGDHVVTLSPPPTAAPDTLDAPACGEIPCHPPQCTRGATATTTTHAPASNQARGCPVAPTDTSFAGIPPAHEGAQTAAHACQTATPSPSVSITTKTRSHVDMNNKFVSVARTCDFPDVRCVNTAPRVDTAMTVTPHTTAMANTDTHGDAHGTHTPPPLPAYPAAHSAHRTPWYPPRHPVALVGSVTPTHAASL